MQMKMNTYNLLLLTYRYQICTCVFNGTEIFSQYSLQHGTNNNYNEGIMITIFELY